MDQVTVPRELLRQVLDYVEKGNPGHIADRINVLVKLRTALEQPAAEPVVVQHRIRVIEKSHPFYVEGKDFGPWQECTMQFVPKDGKLWRVDSAGYEYEYRYLYTAPQAQPAPRNHITDGSTCWCNPEVVYTDPDTGTSVIVHKEPQ